jgi:hypothetical protein
VLSFESYDAIDAHWIMLAIHWKSLGTIMKAAESPNAFMKIQRQSIDDRRQAIRWKSLVTIMKAGITQYFH